MSLNVGIDLGTTNSVISVLDENGQAKVIPNLDGGLTTPSVVHFDGSKFTVGEEAKKLLKVGNENTEGSFKVNIGSVQKYRLAGEELTPKALSAEVLRYLKDSVEKGLNDTIDKCVITVPAYFTELQRKETREAGELAGLNVARIINEPTAAALAYGLNLDEEQTVLVYDLGGGTFDVSLLTVGDGTVEVIGTKGDNHLGGDNFDRELALVILRTLKKVTGYKPTNERVMKALVEIGRSAKEQLSKAESFSLDLSILKEVDSAFTEPEKPIVVKRSDFEKIILKHIAKTVSVTKETVEEAEMELQEVDKIILVGGSTRIPMIKVLLAEATKLPVLTSEIDPDLAISIGATIQASIVSGQNKDMVLLDVTPFDLSVETVGGFASRLIKANSGIPNSKSKIFTTSRDNQEEIKFDIYQGNKPIAKENEFLGELTLTGISKAPKGEPQVEVTFKIDENGELEVTATDIMTFQSMTIKRSLR